jgi:hypothetical protein
MSPNALAVGSDIKHALVNVETFLSAGDCSSQEPSGSRLADKKFTLPRDLVYAVLSIRETCILDGREGFCPVSGKRFVPPAELTDGGRL